MISDKNQLMVTQIRYWKNRIKPSILKGFESSPDEKLDWAPAINMITLGNVFIHISECSEWWIEEVMGDHELKDRYNSQKPLKISRNIVEKYLDSHWKRLERFFASDPAILKKNYKVAGPGKGHIFDGYWIFTHLLEHDVHHRSQINHYLRILGIEPPII